MIKMKENWEYIKYSVVHRLALLYMLDGLKESELLDGLQIDEERIKQHDIDKMFLYCFLPKQEASSLYKAFSKHHFENCIYKDESDIVEALLDYECSARTKKDKPQNAHDTIEQFYPQCWSTFEKYLNKFGWNSSYQLSYDSELANMEVTVSMVSTLIDCWAKKYKEDYLRLLGNVKPLIMKELIDRDSNLTCSIYYNDTILNDVTIIEKTLLTLFGIQYAENGDNSIKVLRGHIDDVIMKHTITLSELGIQLIKVEMTKQPQTIDTVLGKGTADEQNTITDNRKKELFDVILGGGTIGGQINILSMCDVFGIKYNMAGEDLAIITRQEIIGLTKRELNAIIAAGFLPMIK